MIVNAREDAADAPAANGRNEQQEPERVGDEAGNDEQHPGHDHDIAVEHGRERDAALAQVGEQVVGEMGQSLRKTDEQGRYAPIRAFVIDTN